MTRPLRQDDHVEITYDGRTVPGVVMLASENGKSLVLWFDAMLGGHVMNMPVFEGADGVFQDLMLGKPVGVELVEEAESGDGR